MELTTINKGIVDNSITKVEFLTQAEYDALASKSASTIYVIT